MTTNAIPMSQWPSDHRYVIPVAPGPDIVTITIDGKEVQAPRGELLIKVAQQHGSYIPRFCWHERMVSGVVVIAKDQGWSMWIVLPAAIIGALAIGGTLYASLPKQRELVEEIK